MTISKIIEENVTPINNRVNDIDTDIDRLIDNIKKQFGSLTSSISNDMNDVNRKIEDVKTSNEKIKNEMSNVIKGYDDKHSKIIAEIEKRVDTKIGNFKGSIDSEINTISNDINTMSKALSKSASKNDIDVINDKINSMSSSMRNANNNRCDMNEIKMNVDTILTEFEKKIDDKLNDIHQYTQEYIKNFDNDITLLLDKKANLSEMNQLLSAKADSSMINSLLDNKLTKTQFESLSLTVEKMSQDFLNKIDYDKFDAFVSSTNTTLSSIQKDLMMKANILRICLITIHIYIPFMSNNKSIRVYYTQCVLSVYHQCNHRLCLYKERNVKLINSALTYNEIYCIFLPYFIIHK